MDSYADLGLWAYTLTLSCHNSLNTIGGQISAYKLTDSCHSYDVV